MIYLLSGTSVNLLLKFSELARDMRGVAIKHGAISLGNLAGVVHDDDLETK